MFLVCFLYCYQGFDGKAAVACPSYTAPDLEWKKNDYDRGPLAHVVDGRLASALLLSGPASGRSHTFDGPARSYPLLYVAGSGAFPGSDMPVHYRRYYH